MSDIYNPAQQRVIDLLGRTDERPQLPDGLADELRHELEEALRPFHSVLPDGKSYETRFTLNKRGLSDVHACEKFFVDGNGPFEWSTAIAKGTIVHKAVEVSINLRHPMPPADLVEEAVSRLSNDTSKGISDFLTTLDEFGRAELIGICTATFTRFTENFPPIKRTWIPQVESPIALSLAGGRVRISGKLDIALGKPPDKVILDIKTGGRDQSHTDDLRLYALIDLLSIGHAPRKVASYYIEDSVIDQEDINEASLRSTTRRLRDGLVRAIELKIGKVEPVLRPGNRCRWCLHNNDCQAGLDYMTELAERDGW
ncbi:MAG: PD-(D/E)XK nuclease family protein [Ilumatobacteraceae bacterium]